MRLLASCSVRFVSWLGDKGLGPSGHKTVRVHSQFTSNALQNTVYDKVIYV